LPDNTEHIVNQRGHIKLSSRLTLTNVLFVSDFKFNLLSVNKLTKTANIKFVFFPECCVLQDLHTNELLAVGRVIGNLYVLDIKSFDPAILESYKNKESNATTVESFRSSDMVCNANHSSVIWHNRLRHPSSAVAQHLQINNMHIPNNFL